MLEAKKKKGIIASLFVMLLQGWEGAILMLFGLVASLAVAINSAAFATASLFVKELFTIIITLLIFGRKHLINVIKKGFTRVGMIYGVAFITGSTIGSIFLILAIFMAGAGYGPILTVMYPIFTTVFIRIFFKEKTTAVALIGIIITVISGGLFAALPPIITSGEFDLSKIIGILFGAATAICWSIEGVIISHTQKKGVSWNDSELAIWKSFCSFVAIVVLFLPVSMAFDNPYTMIGDIFNSWEAILITLALSSNLVVLRVLYTKSISFAGVRVTSVIDTNNFLITPLISTIVYYSTKNIKRSGTEELLFEPTAWWVWIVIIPILIGVLLVIMFNNSKDKEILDHEK